jgi:tetratricopeptide (TPR) repeat protein
MKTLVTLLLICAVAPADDALELLRDALAKLNALDTDGAEASLTAAIAAEPRIAQAYLARAGLRERADRPEDAARDLECASRLGEDRWRRAATLYVAANAYDEAEHAYEQSWKRTGELEDLVGVADARASAGSLESALLAYSEIIGRVNGIATVQYLVERARIKSAIGRHEEAIKDVDLAISRVPRYARAYQIRGRIRLRQGRNDEGIANHKTAAAQLASHPSSYWILGLAYYDTGDWDNAASNFERAIGFEQEVHAYTHLYLFLARCRGGDPAKRMQASRELMQFIENRKERDDWFSKVGALLTGGIQEPELLEAAREGNRHTRREHLCEAHAYIAGRAMIAGDQRVAREHFRKAQETGVVSFVEYNTAEAELARMDDADARKPDAPK